MRALPAHGDVARLRLRLLLLLQSAAAPVLPPVPPTTCPGGTGYNLPGAIIGMYIMPTGVENGDYAEVSCQVQPRYGPGYQVRPGYERAVGHTVKLCDTSNVKFPWEPVDGGEALLCVPKGTGRGCSGSPDPSKHYENRTLASGQSLSVTCADGYRPWPYWYPGSSNYKCEGTRWVHDRDVPDGQPLVCTADPGGGYCTGPPGAHFRSVTATEGGYVVAACEDSYVATGSSVFVCRATSQNVWQAAPGVTNTLVCTPPTCGASPAEHTKDNCVGTQVGQQCKAECAAGYTPSTGNPTYTQYTCGEGGVWTGGGLRCLSPCTLPTQLPANVMAAAPGAENSWGGGCVAGQPLAAGYQCRVLCAAGYSQDGDDGTYKCNEDSQLLPAAPDCQICHAGEFNPTPGAKACQTCATHCTSGRGSVKCNCTVPAPCNGVDCGHGSCEVVNNGTGHTCSCEAGWVKKDYGTGPCDHATGCDAGPCQHGGTCEANGGAYTCHCIAWKWGGKTCAEPMGCAADPATGTGPCGEHGWCTADPHTGSDFVCNCTSDWSGRNCQNEPAHSTTDDPVPPHGSSKGDIGWKILRQVEGGVVAVLLGLCFCGIHQYRRRGSRRCRSDICQSLMPEEMPDNVKFLDVEVPRTEENQAVWTDVCNRVNKSLPGFTVTRILRKQNKYLLREFQNTIAQMESSIGKEQLNVRSLFHSTGYTSLQKITEGEDMGCGLDPKFAKEGEYGNGIYFAEHAVYCAAFQGGWLQSIEDVAVGVLADEEGKHVEHPRLPDGELSPKCQKKLCTCASEQLGDPERIRQRALQLEADAPAEIQVLLARVALGVTVDFGGRCLSSRSVGEPINMREWPCTRLDGSRRLPPVRPSTGLHYNSVTCVLPIDFWPFLHVLISCCVL
jgi:hypothetical protein